MLTVQKSKVRRSWFCFAMIIALVGTGSAFVTCNQLQASPAGAVQVDNAEGSDDAEASGSRAKPEGDPAARPNATGPSPRAAEIARILGFPITNSMLVTWIVALGLITSAQLATRRMDLAPTGLQNFWEWLVEGLYSFLEQIIGPHLVKRTFWFFATLFIFILAANWVGLIPGVGTIGWGHESANGFKVDRPLFRGATADLNLTLAMALVFFALWIYWVLSEVGPVGLFRELFTGPRAGMPRTLILLLAPVFFAAGCVEVVSILLRPVALCFRLYGNIYAGDTMLETMSTRLPGFAWLLPIPFYFLELLFGFVQALVFMLLAAVFTLLECPQSDDAPTSE